MAALLISQNGPREPIRWGRSRQAALRSDRTFAYISQNWRGKPLVSHQVIIQLIGATTTNTGLTVTCDIDASRYPKGIKVSDADMDAINIERHTFHGDWNYTIKPVPTQQPLCRGYFASDP